MVLAAVCGKMLHAFAAAMGGADVVWLVASSSLGLQDKLQSEGGRWRSLLAAVMEDSKGFW
jgi:hypothetical protein